MVDPTYSTPHPKDVLVPYPRNDECVTLHGKREFADVIRLWILRWGDYAGLFK